MTDRQQTGPLTDVRVLEFSGLGPAPFCGMLLADLGADVVRIDHANGQDYRPEDVEARGRQSIVLDLKKATDLDIARSLAGKADILVEGFRPGVMEKFTLGPEDLLALNPRLVYGRVTGWGRQGPLSQQAGHDLNYLALTGALHAMGPEGKPAIPLNLIADFGGGSMYLVMGLLAALHHAERSGEGQVVDAAMIDGVISMMNMIYGDFAVGTWVDARESNVIDGASPFYNVYACADGKWLSVAAIEPQFYEAFIQAAGIDATLFSDQWRRDAWPERRRILEELFLQKSRDDWVRHFAGVDACVTPVLSLEEARDHPHNRERKSFQTIDGIQQAGAFPHLSRTPAATPFGVQAKDSNRTDILSRWGVSRK